MLTRSPDWAARLTAVVEATRRAPREAGRHDCILFVCDCIAAMTGIDLGREFRGTYRCALGGLRRVREAGGGDLEALVQLTAARMGIAEIDPAQASVGDVVLRDDGGQQVLGIVLGRRAAFVGEKGLLHLDTATCRRAWRI